MSQIIKNNHKEKNKKFIDNLESAMTKQQAEIILGEVCSPMVAAIVIANIRGCSYEGNLMDGIKEYFGDKMKDYVASQLYENKDLVQKRCLPYSCK